MEFERPRLPSPPVCAPPLGACDAHIHVFGPNDVFPIVSQPAYPLPDAPFETTQQMLQVLGISRAVLIQPAPYASDHRALIDALSRGGDNCRGVAVLDAEASEGAFDRLHEAGVRGLRFVEMRPPGSSSSYPGSVSVTALDALAPRMASRKWSAHVWAPVHQCVEIAVKYAEKGVPLVFDHLAGVNAETSVRTPDFRDLLALLREGAIWVKASVCRVVSRGSDYSAAQPFHDAFLETNPSRVLWGTDFPFVRKGLDAPDAGRLLDLFQSWAGDAALSRQVLVDNPAALYGFEGGASERD